jgi:hypothetical protein
MVAATTLKFGVEVTFSGMTSLFNFNMNLQIVSKFDREADRQTDTQTQKG